MPYSPPFGGSQERISDSEENSLTVGAFPENCGVGRSKSVLPRLTESTLGSSAAAPDSANPRWRHHRRCRRSRIDISTVIDAIEPNPRPIEPQNPLEGASTTPFRVALVDSTAI